MYAILHPFDKPARIVGYDKDTDSFKVVCGSNAKFGTAFHPADLTSFIPATLTIKRDKVLVQNCGCENEIPVYVKTGDDAFNTAAEKLEELIETEDHTVKAIASSPEMEAFAKALANARITIVREYRDGVGFETLTDSVANLFPSHDEMMHYADMDEDGEDEDDSETPDESE